MTLSDYISLATLAIALFGGILAWVQWRKTNKIKKAEFLDRITQKIRLDKEFLKTIYLIEYGEFVYDEEFQKTDNPMQYEIDRLLAFLDYICYLREVKIITEKEFDANKYIVDRVCAYKEIKKYLAFLHSFAKMTKKTPPVLYLERYGLETGEFDKDLFE